MARTELKSNNLAAFDYDGEKRVLTIWFKNGAHWEYHDVDPKHATAIERSNSPGGYFHAHIRSAHRAVRVLK